MQEEVKNAGGRPPIYETAEALSGQVDAYFLWVKGEKDPDPEKFGEWIREPGRITITGLALFLGFESRQSIYDYEEKGEFSYIIRKARLRVENQYEQNLHGNNCTGSIFALKNMGWKDRTDATIGNPDGSPLGPQLVIQPIQTGTTEISEKEPGNDV